MLTFKARLVYELNVTGLLELQKQGLRDHVDLASCGVGEDSVGF